MTKLLNFKELEDKCFELRQTVLRMCLKTNTGHMTSSFSVIELLTSLYYRDYINHDPSNPNWDDRDRLILSKAQASPLLYAILADLGYYDKKDLDLFAQKDGPFGVHLQNTVKGVETTAGALGHGLGLASGIALRAKMDRKLFLTYTILGDGELYEGSIWESMKFASHHNLNNLIGIIDRNFLCTTDFTENLIELEPLDKKIESFGWNCVKIDGHNINQIDDSLKDLRNRKSRKPTMIIAETTKGKGLKSMSHDPLFHGVPPKKQENIDKAKKELKI